MHREIEKIYEQFKKFMEEYPTEEMSESEIRKLIDEFERQYNEEFWEIVETRPYMRIKQSYAEILAENGMMKKAVKEYEEILKLNENDNLGVRFRLMSLYAFFEDEENALKLYKKYNGQNSVQMLLPISVLYFKKGEFTKSLNSMTENDYLFLTASSFVEWAYEKLGKKTGGKSKKVVKLKK